MKHSWTKVVLGAALATALTLGVMGCSGGDDAQKDGSTTTDTSAATSTSAITGMRPPTTAGGDQSATTNTPAPGAGAITSDAETVTVGGKPQEEYEAAMPGLVEKAKASPKDLAILQELAIAQYQTQRYEDAAKTYDSMLAIKDDAMTRNNRANVLRDWGKIDEAKSEYEKALSMDPALVVAYMNLASLAPRTDPAEAVTILDRGIAHTTGEDQQRLKDLKTSVQDQSTTTGS